MKLRNLGITTKMILWFGAFAVLLIGGVGIPAYLNGNNSLIAATVSELVSTSLEKQAALENWVAEGQSHLQLLAEIPAQRKMLADYLSPGANSTTTLADLTGELNAWVGAGHAFRIVSVLAVPSGQVLISTDPNEIGKFHEDQPYFISGQTDAYLQNPYFQPSTQSVAITVSRPVTSLDGRVLGVISADLNLEGMNQIVQRRTGLHRTDDAFLINTSHLPVTQPRLAGDASVFLRGIYTPAVDACLNQNSGTIQANDYRGIPAFISYRWMPERNLCLIVKIDQSEALFPIQQFANNILLISLAVLLAGLLLAVFLGRTFTRPIHQLSSGVLALGQGNLDTRIQVTSQDELGRLALSFNAMADNLKQFIEEKAYTQSLLTALSEAAQAVQRAQTPDEIYQVIGQKVEALGQHALIFLLPDDPQSLYLSPVTITAGMRAALGQFPIQPDGNYRLARKPGGFIDQWAQTGQTVLLDSITPIVQEVLPMPPAGQGPPAADTIETGHTAEKGILAPLEVFGKTAGFLMIFSPVLSENDLPAVSTFANQIAIALENTGLYQQAQQRAAALQTERNFVSAILDTSGALILVLDLQGQIVRMNRASETAAGLAAGAALGKFYGDFFADPTEAPRIEAQLNALKTGLKQVDFETSWLAPDGQRHVTSWTQTILPAADGVPSHIISAGLDITELKLAEQALRQAGAELEQRVIERTADLQESEQTALALLNAQSDSAYLTDIHGIILSGNESGASRLQMALADLIGRSIWEVWPPEVSARRKAQAELALQTGQPVRFEDERAGCIFENVIYPIMDANHKIFRLAYYGRDVTDQRQAQEEIRKSEIRFRTLYETAPLGIAFSRAGRNLFANAAYVRMFGYNDADEVFDTPLTDQIAPEAREEIRQRNLRRERGEPVPAMYETIGLRKDGSRFPFSIVVTTVELGDGAATVAFLTDISERRKAEAAVRESELRYRTLSESAQDSIFIINHEMKIEYVNLYAATFLRGTPASIIGQPVTRMFPPAVALEQLNSLQTIFATGEPIFTESKVEFPGSPAVWLDNRLIALKDEDGKTVSILGVSRDITPRKLDEEALARKVEELARSNSELEQFAYVASHDLQEPLRMVASYTQLLQRRYQGRLDSEADEFIHYAVDGAQRMQRLINDLLMYSRVNTRGKEFEPVDCERILANVIAALQISIEESGVIITYDPLPTIRADEMQMGQLFQNLIGNAVKFHGEQPRIHITARREAKEWIFSVQDNGIGIEPQYFERIFIIFQRLHGHEEYAGTGIGLALCKKIIQRHGGRIWVESKPGQGSTFYFSIPSSGEN